MIECYSRYEDPTLVECEDCGWRGTVADCIHTYEEIPGTGGDVEPIDLCPKCEGKNLILLEEELASV